MVDLRAWRAGFEAAQVQALWFTVGVLAMLLLAAAITTQAAQVVQSVLLAVGIGYAVLMLVQWISGHDPVGLLFGSPRYAATLLAVLLPLSSKRLAAILAAGLVAGQSYLALLAGAVGLLAQPRWRREARWIAPALIVGALAIFALRSGPSGPPWPVWQTRAEAYSLAISDLRERPWLGFGPGGWITTVPFRQIKEGQTDLFTRPHSELLGWIYEEGLVGLALLVGWVTANARTLWASDVVGALAALTTLAVGLHVFHIAALVPWLVLVLALGLREVRHG